MELRPVVTRVLLGSGPEPSPYECRGCGTSLDDDPDECPCCGSGDVVHLDL